VSTFEEQVFPTLELFPLHVYETHKAIMMARDHEVVILSPDGIHITSILFPYPPTYPKYMVTYQMMA